MFAQKSDTNKKYVFAFLYNSSKTYVLLLKKKHYKHSYKNAEMALVSLL